MRMGVKWEKYPPFLTRVETLPRKCRLAETASFTYRMMFVEKSESNSHNFSLNCDLQSSLMTLQDIAQRGSD